MRWNVGRNVRNVMFTPCSCSTGLKPTQTSPVQISNAVWARAWLCEWWGEGIRKDACLCVGALRVAWLRAHQCAGFWSLKCNNSNGVFPCYSLAHNFTTVIICAITSTLYKLCAITCIYKPSVTQCMSQHPNINITLRSIFSLLWILSCSKG